ncbi:hypothetical protein B0H10DRAFT_1222569 [Mycena sp. CBHHK59/15]|nr:hypothetical protein B0H10DRAFT_1222569 [Mycena sp. CBHHK59/15]
MVVSSKASIFRVMYAPTCFRAGAKTGHFMCSSFTLAGGDVLQTIPGTYALYKKQWAHRNISPVCFFYAVARYMTIISLISNGIGFYGTHFTPATCKPWYMLPNITAMLAGMAVQVLIFIRTYAISGQSNRVWFGLGAILLIGFPIQAFGIIYHRSPQTSGGECKGKVFQENEPDWNIVYYSAHMGYDLIACATGSFYMVYSCWIQGVFNASKFVRRVLRNGLLYTLVVFLANLWVVLEFEAVLTTGVGSTLPLAVVLIAAQHLILSTQRPGSDAPSSTDEYSRSRSLIVGVRGRGGGPSRLFTRRDSRRTGDLELQSGVFVVTETYVQPRLDERKAANEFEPPDKDGDSESSDKGRLPSVGFAS